MSKKGLFVFLYVAIWASNGFATITGTLPSLAGQEIYTIINGKVEYQAHMNQAKLFNIIPTKKYIECITFRKKAKSFTYLYNEDGAPLALVIDINKILIKYDFKRVQVTAYVDGKERLLTSEEVLKWGGLHLGDAIDVARSFYFHARSELESYHR